SVFSSLSAGVSLRRVAPVVCSRGRCKHLGPGKGTASGDTSCRLATQLGKQAGLPREISILGPPAHGYGSPKPIVSRGPFLRQNPALRRQNENSHFSESAGVKKS